MARFERIARDLEKLPCELHDDILADLEFQQLIRLSKFAGPRLVWSLENSQTSWGIYFRGEGSVLCLRRLLALTEQIKKRCFKLPKTKLQDIKWSPAARNFFEYVASNGPLAFLHYRKSDWSSKASDTRLSNTSHSYTAQFNDCSTLSRHWLFALNEIAINTTWKDLHDDYSRRIEPWIGQVDGASATFGKIPYVGSATAYPPYVKNLADAKREAMTIKELEDFVEMYQRIRVIRAEAFAGELRRLADLYEAHPTQLKMPFAPQTLRPNPKHIPDSMRREAQRMMKRATNTWWKYKEMTRYRFAFQFPAIIPYEWSVQLFRKVMQLNPTLPKIIQETSNIVFKRQPPWSINILGPLETDEIANISKALSGSSLDPKTASIWRTKYCLHTEVEMMWLESFAEVVAWMETEYPDVLRQVRGPEWANPAANM